ncbi:IDEAL domain-containing protein [Paenibacillus xylaniclasticus]|uniref:IDEAL domain-containing protein n=1 Tax=Paenibacillus xylaniclasticus TaxID=588083 RepID=UPI000FDC2F0B|nr:MULTISPECIES: IDEAL domain-containing protein [Paenibacillus]
MAKIDAYNYNLELLDVDGMDMNQLDDLIDIVLSTKDREWFLELTNAKLSVKNSRLIGKSCGNEHF